MNGTGPTGAPVLSRADSPAPTTALARTGATFVLNSLTGEREEARATIAKIASHFDALPRSEESLAYAEEAVRALRRDGCLRLFAIGHVLRVVRDRLWMTRGRYKGFGQWTKDVLGWSESHANKVIRIVEVFGDSGVDVDTIGIAKLTLVLGAPPEKQPELLEAAKAGASRSQLQAAASGKSKTPVPGAVALGLRAVTTEIPLTRLGADLAAAGFLAGAHGGGIQLAIGRAADGTLRGHVSVIGTSLRS